jgi:hypothetical protein
VVTSAGNEEDHLPALEHLHEREHFKVQENRKFQSLRASAYLHRLQGSSINMPVTVVLEIWQANHKQQSLQGGRCPVSGGCSREGEDNYCSSRKTHKSIDSTNAMVLQQPLTRPATLGRFQFGGAAEMLVLQSRQIGRQMLRKSNTGEAKNSKCVASVQRWARRSPKTLKSAGINKQKALLILRISAGSLLRGLYGLFG